MIDKSEISFELTIDDITGVIDPREQLPLSMPFQTVQKTLPTGDYSIFGLEHVVAVERKSLQDLIACVGRERERFDREIQRLLAYSVRAVVIEAPWTALEAGDWKGDVTPQAAMGSVLGWIASGIPFIFAGTRDGAAKAVARLLFIAARRRWREARSLVGDVATQKKSKGKAKLSPNAKDPNTIAAFDVSLAEEVNG
jgi:ERCC4-type nuclease